MFWRYIIFLELFTTVVVSRLIFSSLALSFRNLITRSITDIIAPIEPENLLAKTRFTNFGTNSLNSNKTSNDSSQILLFNADINEDEDKLEALKTEQVMFTYYYIGIIPGSLVGAWVSKNFQSTRIIAGSILISTCIVVFFPIGLKAHFSVVIVMQNLISFFLGPIIPALYCLMANWSHPSEIPLVMLVLTGNGLCYLTFSSIFNALAKYEVWNFTWNLYLVIFISLAWLIPWMILVTDRPEENRFIGAAEKDFLTETRQPRSMFKIVIPLKEILTNSPFWALLFLHVGTDWSFFSIVYLTPRYLEKAGFITEQKWYLYYLPLSLHVLVQIICCICYEVILNYTRVTKNRLMKVAVIISHLLPAIFTIGLTNVDDNEKTFIVFLVLNIAFSGANIVTTYKIGHDISPRFVGPIYGITTACGMLGGMLSPFMLQKYIHEKSTIHHWKLTYFFTSVIYFLTGIVFIALGSVEEQPFNNIVIYKSKK